MIIIDSYGHFECLNFIAKFSWSLSPVVPDWLVNLSPFFLFLNFQMASRGITMALDGFTPENSVDLVKKIKILKASVRNSKVSLLIEKNMWSKLIFVFSTVLILRLKSH